VIQEYGECDKVELEALELRPPEDLITEILTAEHRILGIMDGLHTLLVTDKA